MHTMDERYQGLEIVNFAADWRTVRASDGTEDRFIVVVFTLRAIDEDMIKTTERTILLSRDKAQELTNDVNAIVAESAWPDERDRLETLMNLAHLKRDPSMLPGDHPLIQFAYTPLATIEMHRSSWSTSIVTFLNAFLFREFIRMDVSPTAGETFRLSVHLHLARLFAETLQERLAT
jgi:hypothetical protein